MKDLKGLKVAEPGKEIRKGQEHRRTGVNFGTASCLPHRR
jgi:hypothetical protein